MKSISIGVDVEYLLGYLTDELSDMPELRIHAVAPSTTQKSVDLPQDYDPNSNDVHLKRGVRVRMKSREFFFPANWVKDQRLDLVYAQVDEIRKFTHD
ncbi:MAG: hypothetical protein H7333_09625 [Bdellovibrionales bacterium]|nr:hypothetical protein [Oligoflexia bacterium]